MKKPASHYWLRLLSLLSLRSQYWLASGLAYIVARTSNQISRQTRENIRLCFAEQSSTEQQRLYRESIRHTGYAMIELATIWHRPIEQVMELITAFDVCPQFSEATKARIVLLPHLGSWETFGMWLGQQTDPLYLYKPQRNPALDQYIIDLRARTGGEPVPTNKSGLRRLLNGIRQGRTLVILPDQKPGSKSAQIKSTFFGFDAPTTALVHSLCSKLECEVFIATMYRSTPPGEFGLRIEALEFERLSADETESAAYMNGAIERLVQRYPEQYQWGYRRFSSAAYRSLQPGN